MVLPIIRIRAIQAKRILFELGFFRIIFLAALFVFVLLGTYGLFSSEKKYFSALFILLPLYIHFNRPDKRFMSSITNNPYKIFAAEYIILSIPITLIALLSPNKIISIIFPAAACIVPLFNFNLKPINYSVIKLNFIPSELYEWKSGIRKNPFIIVLYIAALFFCFLPYVSLFLIWFTGLFLLSFYDECESLQILQTYNKSAAEFVTYKLFLSLKTYLIAVLPVLLLYHTFNNTNLMVTAFVITVGVINIIIFVLAKYTFFQPSTQFANPIIQGITLVGNIIPLVFIVNLLIAIRFYFTSVKNMRLYL